MSPESINPRTLVYARHIGRELALLSLSSLTQYYSESELESLALAEILERSVRMLTSESEDYLKSSGKALETVYEQLEKIDTDNIEEINNLRDLQTARKNLQRELEQIKNSLKSQAQEVSNAINLLGDSLNIPLLRTLADNPQVRNFTLALVNSYRDHKADIDSSIDSVSEEWSLERMNSIDRDLIRIAATEMLFDPIAAAAAADATPLPVAINEAVELAKKYGTPESYRFVNAILRNLLPQAEERRRRRP